jgi:hypothetical protein
MSFTDIVAGLRAGGCTQFDEDALRRSLIRSTYEIAKINDDLFGLVEFYPHLKRGRRRRRIDVAIGDRLQASDETEVVTSEGDEFVYNGEDSQDSGD